MKEIKRHAWASGSKLHWIGIPEQKQEGQRQFNKGWEIPSIEERHQCIGSRSQRIPSKINKKKCKLRLTIVGLQRPKTEKMLEAIKKKDNYFQTNSLIWPLKCSRNQKRLEINVLKSKIVILEFYIQWKVFFWKWRWNNILDSKNEYLPPLWTFTEVPLLFFSITETPHFFHVLDLEY